MSGDQVDSPYRNPQTARIVEEGLVRLRQLEINRKKESPSPPVRMVEGKSKKKKSVTKTKKR